MSRDAKPLTGRKVLLIAVGAFGVIVAANMAMLLAATGTFPGLVVENSYIASQGWDRKTAAQRALGWTAATDYDGAVLRVILTGRDGATVRGLEVRAMVGRPASTRDDTALALAESAEGYAAPLTLAPGRWRVMISGRGDDGILFEAESDLHIPEAG